MSIGKRKNLEMSSAQPIALQPQKSANFNCDHCQFTAVYIRDYERHLVTKKHLRKSSLPMEIAGDNKDATIFQCEICTREYQSASGLWKHNKVCKAKEASTVENKFEPTIVIESSQADNMKDIIVELLKQNKEFQTTMINQFKEALEQVKPNISNNNYTNNNNTNNQFNIQIFLNEKCKDAINLQDFLENLVVTAADFEETGKLGFVNGISRIFVNKLNELDVYTRPLHCTDLKRETVYIKNSDMWEKETDEKTKLKTAVKTIAKKNLKALQPWSVENPEFRINNTKSNDEYVKLSLAALGASNEDEEEKFDNKIIKNVLAKVVIDKNVK
jgi:hypothetical protein